MKITINEERNIVLKEVYSGILMETEDGNALGICMRDDTFEINVIPKQGKTQWFRVDMQNITIKEEGKAITLEEEHRLWAKDFGGALVRIMQGDYSIINALAKNMKIDFPNGEPHLQSVVTKPTTEGGENGR